MTPDQSVRAHHIRLLPGLSNRVLVLSQDSFCTDSIRIALQPVLGHVYTVTTNKDLHFALCQTRPCQLVIIDTAGVGSLDETMNAIRFTWPDSELILISEDMYSWTELIQRGAYEILPKPVNSGDLVWAAVGALLRHTPTAMRAAG